MELRATYQVTTFEQSRRLFDLGLPQDTLFVWYKYSMAPAPVLLLDPERQALMLSGKLECAYAAFTVAELGERLHYDVPVYDDWHTKNNKKFSDKGKQAWYFTSPDGGDEYRHEWIAANNECDARTQMLIYKLEHKRP